ncbi:MAG: polyphosphate:AMP phosphotransferase, partial [Gammaproteobacteria bacterium]
MFKAVELDKTVTKSAFRKRERVLRTELLEAQNAAAERNIPILIIVSGVEGAGRGQFVDRLNAWMDTRGIVTHAFWDETDEERERPRFWRFWRRLPRRGQIAVMFGAWYTHPIFDRALGALAETEFDHEMRRINALERMLVLDGALIVKLWFHLSKHTQMQRLKDGPQRNRSPLIEMAIDQYDALAAAAERAIRLTDDEQHPWTLIEAQDPAYRDLSAGEVILNRIRARIAPGASQRPGRTTRESSKLGHPAVLDRLELTVSLDEDEYDRRFQRCRAEIYQRSWKAHNEKVNVVAVFEGWDAAGKGSAIRRLTQAIDGRLYQVITVSSPSDEELAHHYLWRFWRHVPRAGQFTIYDRSWYGRVLVERIEGLASPREWQRAYGEINDFEEQLVEHGVVLLKFWIHISPDVQLARFHEREATPWKQHKITEEDWRNREMWDAYDDAANEMIARTS